METKFCTRCQLTKSIVEFSSSSTTKDRLNFYCRTCQSEVGKEAYRRKKQGIKNRLTPEENNQLFQQGKKLCRKCNTVKSTEEFSNCSTLTHYKSRYCRDCMIVYHHSARGRFSAYKSTAHQSRRGFFLSFTDFEQITQKNCQYCNQLGVNGIDRINNSDDYTLMNCQPCCKICNFMKEDKSVAEFMGDILSVYNFSVLGKTPEDVVQVIDLDMPKKIKRQFANYKGSAKNRKIVFALTFEKFSMFYKQRCHYCGVRILDNARIDRLNNEQGYTCENCVPCCTRCNYLKKKLTVLKFLSHITKIVNNCKCD